MVRKAFFILSLILVAVSLAFVGCGQDDPTGPAASQPEIVVDKSSGLIISNVVRTFDPMGCQFTTTWTTNVAASSTVYWGLSSTQLTNVVNGSGYTTSHSISFDATDIPLNSRVYIKVESIADAESGTDSVRRNYCISG